jgi:uncharacterized membrane protein YhaH (DUF805 family)
MSQTTNPFFLANLDAMNRYADFTGTTTRAQFWLFFLGANGATFIATAIVGPVVGNVLSIFFLIPSITAGVRRLHDVGKSGWFFLVPIYNIILLASPSKI